MLLGNKSYTIWKPVYFPPKWCHICKENTFVGWPAELSVWVAPMKTTNAKHLILLLASGTPSDENQLPY